MIKASIICIILQISIKCILLTVSNLTTTTLKQPSQSTLVIQTYHTYYRSNFLGDGAQWLWMAGGSSWPINAQITVQSLFTSDCSSNPGVISITADDRFTLYLNSIMIGTGTAWQSIFRFNVTYKNGTNNLTAVATNLVANSPASVIFKVTQEQACPTNSNSSGSNSTSNSTNQNSTNQNETNSNSTNQNSTNSNSTNNSTNQNGTNSNSTNQNNTGTNSSSTNSSTNQTNQSNSSDSSSSPIRVNSPANQTLVIAISVPIVVLMFGTIAYLILKQAPQPQPTQIFDLQKKTQSVDVSEEGISRVEENIVTDKQ